MIDSLVLGFVPCDPWSRGWRHRELLLPSLTVAALLEAGRISGRRGHQCGSRMLCYLCPFIDTPNFCCTFHRATMSSPCTLLVGRSSPGDLAPSYIRHRVPRMQVLQERKDELVRERYFNASLNLDPHALTLTHSVRSTQGQGLMPDSTSRFTCKGKPVHHFVGNLLPLG